MRMREVYSREIIVANTRGEIEVCATVWHDDGTYDQCVCFAGDTNDWATTLHVEIPDGVTAVLRQIYLHCRNISPLRWIRETSYTLDAQDKMFEPLWAWLEGKRAINNKDAGK